VYVVIGLPQGGMWRVRFNRDASSYDSSFFNWHSFDTMADRTGLNGCRSAGMLGWGCIAALFCRGIDAGSLCISDIL
jgi:hypothetical protein